MFKKFKKLFPKIKNKIFLCNYYPINTTLFKPRNKFILRKKYGVPVNKRVVFFSAQQHKHTTLYEVKEHMWTKILTDDV